MFPENKWVRFDVIYYEYGALVLDFSSADKATRVFNILKDALFDDKQLLVLLLPNIQVSSENSCYFYYKFAVLVAVLSVEWGQYLQVYSAVLCI